MTAHTAVGDELADTPDDDALSESSRPRIVAARKWIERQYMRPLTVARIARHVGLPPIRLEREFSEVYGESPRTLLMRCRMQEAQRLISSGLSETETALMIGYANERRFLVDYRRWVNQQSAAKRSA